MTDLGTRYYVLEDMHADPARVMAGPVGYQEAKRIGSIGVPTADVTSALWLVHNIRDNDYQVEWADDVEKPGPLKQTTSDDNRQEDD